MRAAELWIEGRRHRRIPAISAAVVQGDATVWAKGFGTTDRALQQPATPDTIYSICSISKLFTAVALMQQWEQGKVALDAPIETYLPWATLAADDRESVPVTRGLLTHSAGLPREADFPYWTGPDYPFPEPGAGPRHDRQAGAALPRIDHLAVFEPRPDAGGRDGRGGQRTGLCRLRQRQHPRPARPRRHAPGYSGGSLRRADGRRLGCARGRWFAPTDKACSIRRESPLRRASPPAWPTS